MIPNYYKKINEIPLTISGKLNRKELPDIDNGDIIKEEYIAPETETEKLICHIYSKLFNIDENEIGRNNDFFELGGDSLNAIRLISIFKKELNIKLNIKEIYEHSLIIDLSKYIEEILNSDDHSKDVEIIKKRNSKEFPITSQQLGVYIDSIKNENTIIYNMPFSYKLNTNINIEKIKEGFNKIFKNQEIFRTKYYSKEVNGKEEIYGFIDDECNLEFEEYTYDNVSSFIRPFDLSKAPLIRIGFIRNDYLLIDIHHVIADGSAILIILNELNNYYNEGNISELEIQYSDYAIDMKEKQDNGFYDKQIEFYRKMFNNEYEIAKIPEKEKDNKLENANNFNMNSLCSKIIDKSTSDMINEFIKKNGISKTSFFLTIYGFVLSKYSGQDIIYTSVLNANRSNHYIENMVGMFVSTLPILLKYDKENEPFIDTIKENMNTLIEIFNNQNNSLAELNKILKLKKINNLFIFQPNVSINENKSNGNKSNENEIFDNEEYEDVLSMVDKTNNNNKSKFDIEFSIIEKENEYFILIQYDNTLYENEIIGNLIDSYIEVIKNVNKFENQNIDIEYLPLNEKQMIIEKFNSDINVEGCDKFYHEEFSKMANQYPDKCAVAYNDLRITYRELNEMSNSLGHYIRENGIGRNDIIPIISDRSPYYIISMISISKAGGAFLPIDPKLPIERIQFILEEVNPKMILYSNNQNVIDELLHLNENYRVYDVQKHNYELNIESIDNINEPDDICYVLFTSGTTGKPKGALITHFNIYNNLRSYDFNGNCDDHLCLYNLIKHENINNILGITNFSFDIANNEITFSLIHGYTTVLVDEKISEDIQSLSKYIINNNVDIINTTPTRFKLFMENEEFKQTLKNIKVAIFSGEELPFNLCIEIHQYSNCKIINGYGPTECYFCSYKEINEREENKITIGKPICNYTLYVLDKYLKPVPIGVEGEIFIGGYGVGKGYLNREELTKEKFINNPFNYNDDNHNEIIYRTGDLGKWTRNGEIEYLGRIDFQVKIHGQRVELDEIESIVNEIKDIKLGVVIDKKRENGEKYLVCYYQLYENNENEIDGADIRKYLKNKLPLYMIPNYYKKINEIPLTISGKLNRKELPEIDNGDIIKEEYAAPETETEKLICHIYSKLFNIDKNEIEKTSDFFELGGDKEILNSDDHSKDVEIIKKHNCKEFPITSQQLGVYIDSIKNENTTLYNIPLSFKLSKNVNIEKIKEGFNEIFQNQEILKTKYYSKEVNGKEEIYGFIDDECNLEFEEYNYENASSFIRPFDLSKAPLIHIGFIENDYLLIDTHHIISDGATSLIIMNELNKYYNEGNISELEIQYSDYAINMKEKQDNGIYDKQIEYYKNMFNTEYEIAKIPEKEKDDKLINDKNSNMNSFCSEIIDESTSIIINEFIKKYGITKTSFFLTIYGFVLSKYSSQDIIYTSVINANRSNHYIENMIGMFVSTLPILLKYENENNSFTDIIKRNMNTLIEIFSNQNISLAELNKTLKLKKINNLFIFQPKVSIDESNIIENSVFSSDATDDEFEIVNNKTVVSKFDIEFGIIEKENEYLISIQYDNSLYDNEIIENIIDSYIEVTKNINSFSYSIKNIEYIAVNEKEMIINKFNSEVNVEDCDKLYHEEFINIVKQCPDKCAIVYNDLRINYKELNEMSNSLGHYIRENGIGRNDIIPIISDRSPYYIISMISISKAGGAFLPIDPKLPIERIQLILEEIKPKMILYSNNSNFKEFIRPYDITKDLLIRVVLLNI
ncbi:acetyl-CoA synthetase-like protein [Anaeromyces robustus]|uniref:Acetyl-CoA synthetase-like protein n=1 Tax=Anaeromyces robustus TaxID=1754192 RepID=A0A1Y1X4D4_9FUNG|nr:acetyl-CoA synthetase-like protein [Anaeromyces robustus]|eukprot:ORX80515.1 acetyl-CoA synthetase-like protein [Anaeromyces robustus]